MAPTLTYRYWTHGELKVIREFCVLPQTRGRWGELCQKLGRTRYAIEHAMVKYKLGNIREKRMMEVAELESMILDYFEKGISARELPKLLNRHKNTTYRILRCMIDRGIITKVGDNKRDGKYAINDCYADSHCRMESL